MTVKRYKIHLNGSESFLYRSKFGTYSFNEAVKILYDMFKNRGNDYSSALSDICGIDEKHVLDERNANRVISKQPNMVEKYKD